MKLGLGSFLTLLFVILKLTGVISWGWVLVFIPLMVSFAFSIIAFIIGLIAVYLGIEALDKMDDW